MPKAQIGSLVLGSVPRVVAIIDEMVPVQTALKFIERGADLLEIRIDRISAPFAEIMTYAKKLRKGVKVPIIGTIRETRGNKSKRQAMFEEITPLVDCIDIEINTEICQDVVKMAKGKTVIVSEHDFDKMPSDSQLVSIVNRAVELGADIVKIAAQASSFEDVTRLLRFNQDRGEPMVTIAMGEAGTISRFVAPLFGSLFTYGYTNKAVAPGQISLESLVDGMRMLYPAYDRMFDQFAQ
jgi:3-dehydroquinate dehydratase I